MSRVKRGVKARRRRNKVFKRAKGFYGARNNVWKAAVQQVYSALADSYVGRKRKKRDYRRLWIARINAAARLNGISYSRLISGLQKKGIELDRKALAEIAVSDPAGFTAIVAAAK